MNADTKRSGFMREAPQSRIPFVLGLATLWGFFWNARLFPISLSSSSIGGASSLALYFAFGCALACSCACIWAFVRHAEETPRNRCVLPLASGALCVAGVALIRLPSSDSPAFLACTTAGISLVAFFMASHFWYWTSSLRSRPPHSGLVDATFSAILFCLVSALLPRLGEAYWPFVLLPLFSSACVAADEAANGGPCSKKDGESLGLRRKGGQADDFEEQMPLLIRILAASIIYFYLAKIMDVGIDLISLTAIDSYRLQVFVIAALIVALIGFSLSRKKAPVCRRLTNAFSIVSICLLGALLVTCCETIGLLPLGNYSIVALKLPLDFFIWLMLALYPYGRRADGALPTAIGLYLVLVLWIPNFAHSALISIFPTERTSELSGLFLAILATALAVALISNLTIASLASRTQSSASPAKEEKLPREAANGALDKEIDAFRSRYNLSAREADVVRLACRGKTAKRIAKELFIAESTAYTHLKHVYRKTNVHSRQELVDLVETFASKRSDSMDD